MKVIIDSDALYGLFVKTDPHFERAKNILKKLIKDKADLYMLNLVIQETTTVISHKLSQQDSLDFLDKINELNLIQINLDLELEKRAWLLFKQQAKKNISFIDCANLASIEYYKIDRIFSFDTFYPKKLLYF